MYHNNCSVNLCSAWVLLDAIDGALGACSTVNERSLSPIMFFEDFYQRSFWSDVSDRLLWWTYCLPNYAIIFGRWSLATKFCGTWLIWGCQVWVLLNFISSLHQFSRDKILVLVVLVVSVSSQSKCRLVDESCSCVSIQWSPAATVHHAASPTRWS